MTCLVCLVAFAGVAGRALYNTILAPVLGAVLNILMLFGVLYFAIAGGGNTQIDTLIAVGFCLVWLIVGFGFLYIRKLVTGVPILHPEDHKTKSATSVESMVTAEAE